jgi:hypothetical protein
LLKKSLWFERAVSRQLLAVSGQRSEVESFNEGSSAERMDFLKLKAES